MADVTYKLNGRSYTGAYSVAGRGTRACRDFGFGGQAEANSGWRITALDGRKDALRRTGARVLAKYSSLSCSKFVTKFAYSNVTKLENLADKASIISIYHINKTEFNPLPRRQSRRMPVGFRLPICASGKSFDIFAMKGRRWRRAKGSAFPFGPRLPRHRFATVRVQGNAARQKTELLSDRTGAPLRRNPIGKRPDLARYGVSYAAEPPRSEGRAAESRWLGAEPREAAHIAAVDCPRPGA